MTPFGKHAKENISRAILLMHVKHFLVLYILHNVSVKLMKSVNYDKFHLDFLFKYWFVSKPTVYKYWLWFQNKSYVG